MFLLKVILQSLKFPLTSLCPSTTVVFGPVWSSTLCKIFAGWCSQRSDLHLLFRLSIGQGKAQILLLYGTFSPTFGLVESVLNLFLPGAFQ